MNQQPVNPHVKPEHSLRRPVLQRWLVFLLIVFTQSIAFSQYNSLNPRDDKYPLLGLKRAKEYYEVTKKDFERQQDLFKKGLISQSDLDRAQNTVADAEVNYQQSLLSVLFEQQFVSIGRAVKYQAADGSKRVKLTLENASASGEEFEKLIGVEDKLFRSLQPDLISTLYVSLYNNDGSIISQPYETKVTNLRTGKPQTIDLAMLQDLDAVTVNIIYGNGTTRTMKILLEKDDSANKVAIQSQQFSQEAELGNTATYDLTFELYSGKNNTFRLDVVNLPQQIDRYFKDAASDAKLTQIRFTETSNSIKAALVVTLPDRPTDRVPMDKPIEFYVVAVPTDSSREAQSLATRTMTEEELKTMRASYARLELVPRGKGRLLVRAPQLYYSIKPDGSMNMYVDIVNEGTRRLDNVKVDVDVPLGWSKTVEPLLIPKLEINEEHRVTLTATPPKGITVGRYEIRLRTSGLSDNQPVNAEDKTVTVEVLAEANVLGTVALVVLIVGLVAGLVVFGARLSKR